MVKLASLLIILSAISCTSFADQEGNVRTIPLETFKGRFTTGELIDLSAAYVEDAYIRYVILKLKDIGNVDLDSAIVKNGVAYLTSKSILSIDRAKDILK